MKVVGGEDEENTEGGVLEGCDSDEEAEGSNKDGTA